MDYNGNTNNKSGRYFTVITEYTDMDFGFSAYSFYHAEGAGSVLDDNAVMGFKSTIVLTPDFYSGPIEPDGIRALLASS